MARFCNLALLVLFPIAWFAPLMRAGLLPLFGLSEISVFSGLLSLWKSDVFLAILVFLLAFIAPYSKTLILAGIQFGALSPKYLPIITWLGKFAMADIFLVALYIVVIKGTGVGRVETGWGLYLFSFCVLSSLGLSIYTDKQIKAAG
ncbi:MAG: paraquat-inducible protein A [Pseudoruegeria sp.]